MWKFPNVTIYIRNINTFQTAINAHPHIDDECPRTFIDPKFILVEYFKLSGEIKIKINFRSSQPDR